jgi:hypothetical protein
MPAVQASALTDATLRHRSAGALAMPATESDPEGPSPGAAMPVDEERLAPYGAARRLAPPVSPPVDPSSPFDRSYHNEKALG